MLAVLKDSRFESAAHYEKYENALAALQYDELAELPHPNGIRHYMTESGEPIKRPYRFTLEKSHSRHTPKIPRTTRSSDQDGNIVNEDWVVAMDEALYGTPDDDEPPAVAQPNSAVAAEDVQSTDLSKPPARGESPATVISDGTTPPLSPIKRVRELQKSKSKSKSKNKRARVGRKTRAMAAVA